MDAPRTTLPADRRPGIRRLADRLDAVLPQTQCRRCGHAGCRPYAEAIARGDPINRCPPGGEAAIAALAALTGRAPLPLDATRGSAGPLLLARIDEARCIGCTLCIQACPVDAIAGAAKRMHTVLPALCTGCELCLPPCPVDCIELVPAGRAWSTADAAAARIRHATRNGRQGVAGTPDDVPTPARARPEAPVPLRAGPAYRQQAVAAALDRARSRRRGPAGAAP